MNRALIWLFEAVNHARNAVSERTHALVKIGDCQVRGAARVSESGRVSRRSKFRVYVCAKAAPEQSRMHIDVTADIKATDDYLLRLAIAEIHRMAKPEPGRRNHWRFERADLLG